MRGSPSRFAAWLDTTMQTHGLSQAALARQMGVADAQVSRWRRGQVTPTLHYLQRIAEIFGVPRTTLDQIAGYPVAAALVSQALLESDPERLAEQHAYQARLALLLEERVPRPLWRAYVDSCEALAEALASSYRQALGDVPRAAAVPGAEPSNPKRTPDRQLGFRP